MRAETINKILVAGLLSAVVLIPVLARRDNKAIEAQMFQNPVATILVLRFLTLKQENALGRYAIFKHKQVLILRSTRF